MSPRTLFRIFANAEMVTWAGLIVALVLRATGVTAAAVPIAGGVHGFVFLAYCVSTVLVWVNQRWRAGLGIVSLVISAVPFATVPLEIAINKRGLLSGPWRLAPGGDEPRGLIERALALVLRRPLVSMLVLIAVVIAVFFALLYVGPPVSRD